MNKALFHSAFILIMISLSQALSAQGATHNMHEQEIAARPEKVPYGFIEQTYVFEKQNTLFEKIYFIDLLFVLDYLHTDFDLVNERAVTFNAPHNLLTTRLHADIKRIEQQVAQASANWSKFEQGLYMAGCFEQRGEDVMNYVMGRGASNDSCRKSFPFCTGTTYNYPAGVNSGTAQTGAFYGCLTTMPNPAWYHLRIGSSGSIIITMQSNPLKDIDYICWGPFSSPLDPCVAQLMSNKVVSCSYSSSATEVCTIPNAVAGEYFILLITNYSDQPCNINFSQTGGTGSTDCTIVPPPISNNGPLCVGATLQLNVQNPIPGSTYNWTGPNGWTSSLQNPFIANIDLSHAGSYTLIITLNNQQSLPISTLVQIGLPPSPVISGPVQACQESQQNYTVQNPTQGNIYQWQIVGGEILNGQGLANVLVRWTIPNMGSLRVSETSYYCQDVPSPLLNVIINPLPSKPATPAGPAELCNGGQAVIYSTTSAANALTYTWQLLPANAGSISGTGTQALVNWNPQFTGNAAISVRGNNNCGEGVYSEQLQVLINPFPSQPQPPTGPTELCNGQQGVIYSTTTTLNALSYQWQLLPAHAGSISGTGTQALLDLNPQFNGIIELRVLGINNCGEGISSDQLQVVINPFPSQPPQPTGPTELCKAQQSSIYSTTATLNALSYNWQLLPANAGSISGTGTQALVNWNPQYTGIVAVRVIGINNCGEGSFSNQLQVIRRENPIANAGDDMTIPHGTNTTLQGNASGGSSPYTFSWQPASLLIDPSKQSPLTVNLFQTTTFT
ncbi:MAG: hypothetical protein Q8M23_05330, partial [Bacteroidales bacterium]|nr:hypothetical protein [Bacteroidales bacterium]